MDNFVRKGSSVCPDKVRQCKWLYLDEKSRADDVCLRDIGSHIFHKVLQVMWLGSIQLISAKFVL
eukprot:3047946-Karenia_brevis.AAC.1